MILKIILPPLTMRPRQRAQTFGLTPRKRVLGALIVTGSQFLG
jgi:hypothetical protein